MSYSHISYPLSISEVDGCVGQLGMMCVWMVKDCGIINTGLIVTGLTGCDTFLLGPFYMHMYMHVHASREL